MKSAIRSTFITLLRHAIRTVVMLLAALLFVTSAAAAVPAGWKATGFAINANGMTLDAVLQEFCVTYGVKLQSAVPAGVLLHGRLQGQNGAEFLDRLAAKHGFRWFVYNDNLHVVPGNDVTSMRLEVGEDAVADSKPALIGLGLFDARFGWGELPDVGAVLVSGPRRYVEMVRETLLPAKDKKRADGEQKQLMVFRLKYASATDRTISTRGQADNVVPGVKTILSGLLNVTSASPLSRPGDVIAGSEKRSRTAKNGRGAASELIGAPANGESSRTLLASAREINGRGRNPADYEEGDEDRRFGRQKTPSVRIDADQSLNAIIIYDSASKRETYQQLIAELDIEPQQIEIEALIVDIDRNKLDQLGAEWGFASGNLSAVFNGTATTAQGVAAALSGSTLLIRNAANFYARLTAMESKGDARVLAKPTISTLENIAAVLDLSTSAYLPLVGERVVDLASVNVGTLLKVTPRIVHDGGLTRVRLDINIEDGTITSQTTSSANVAKSTITTQAIIEPQHTLLIGGYHAEKKSTTRQKIPLLGDLPVVGALFQANTSDASDKERLFLITPRILGVTAAQARSRESTVSTRAREMLGSEPTPVKTAPPQPQSMPEQRPPKLLTMETTLSAASLAQESPASAMDRQPLPVNNPVIVTSVVARAAAPARVLESPSATGAAEAVLAADLPLADPRTSGNAGVGGDDRAAARKRKKQEVLLLRYRQ
jgi:type III secretion protein C